MLKFSLNKRRLKVALSFVTLSNVTYEELNQIGTLDLHRRRLKLQGTHPHTVFSNTNKTVEFRAFSFGFHFIKRFKCSFFSANSEAIHWWSEEKMSDNLKGRVNALGERLKIGGAEVGRKMSAGMSSVSFKVKEFFQDSSHADKLVGEATSEALHHPHWPIILHLCDLINGDQLNTAEVVRAIKKRVVSKSPRSQYLALVLLEALVKNCDKAFLEVATERVLEEMVKLVDDPYAFVNNRNKALMMIEAWGESTTELRYLPVYAQTYKVLSQLYMLITGQITTIITGQITTKIR